MHYFFSFYQLIKLSMVRKRKRVFPESVQPPSIYWGSELMMLPFILPLHCLNSSAVVVHKASPLFIGDMIWLCVSGMEDCFSLSQRIAFPYSMSQYFSPASRPILWSYYELQASFWLTVWKHSTDSTYWWSSLVSDFQTVYSTSGLWRVFCHNPEWTPRYWLDVL